MSNQNTFSKTSGRTEDIDKEVAHLIKKTGNKAKATYAIIEDLKQKYKDDQIVDAVMAKYNEKLKKVRKIAEKIRDRLVSKYPNFSMKEYIEKVTEYKKKYNFDDSEMNHILHLLFHNTSRLSNTEVLDVTYNEMSKALGFVPANLSMSGKMNVKQDEMEQLDAIMTIAAVTKELHSHVTLQSLIYEDCSKGALVNKLERSKYNIFSYVHPVVAALFIPKFEFLDQHMLIASIANIVQQRYLGNELTTQPDYELYMDIATDPSETACSMGKPKPFTDLLNRCNVQTKLWEAVLNLRQGKYYTNDLNSFILAIDNCKNSIFDAADMAYVKDEGTILRKLLSAFSIRPTIVSTAPLYGISSATSNIATLAATHITTISMITMRIPVIDNKSAVQSIKLQDALEQRQLYIHRRQITVKSQTILYSRDILVFYVHRRYQHLNLNRLLKPYAMIELPITMSAYEKLHNATVDFSWDFDHNNQTFKLKSVVAVETAPVNAINNLNKDDIIISCSALINTGDFQSAVKYAPLDIGGTDSTYIYPMDWLPTNANLYSDEESMYSAASTRGTLFIFRAENKSGETNLGF
jgi:hypothetical protein